MKFKEWSESQNEMPDSKQFKMIACVLHAASQKELVRSAQRFSLENTGCLIPPHWSGKAHHILIKNHPTIRDMQDLESRFGRPVLMQVHYFVQDKLGLAAIVNSPIMTNHTQYITIAHSPEVRSDYSINLIKDKSLWKRFPETENLYTYLLAIESNDNFWPMITAKLASPSTLVK